MRSELVAGNRVEGRNFNINNGTKPSVVDKFKVVNAGNSIGDVIVRPGRMEPDVKRPKGKAGISGASVAYPLGLMGSADLTARQAMHEVKVWEHTVMGRNITIPVSEDGTIGGELLREATAFENMGHFGVATYNNAMELEKELHKLKGKTKTFEENIPYNKANAVVIVHSKDWTVEDRSNPIIRVDPTRVGGEIKSLANNAAMHGVKVNASILKKKVYEQTKTVIELNAKGLPIFDVRFEGDRVNVKSQGVVHAPR